MPIAEHESFIDKIVDVYRRFQQRLKEISHRHLESSKDLMNKIDEAHQEDLRRKIREQ